MYRAISLLFMIMMIPTLAGANTTITYQGQLKQSGAPFTGTADLEFQVFDALSGGFPASAVESRDDWPIDEGLFQVELDFGDVYAGPRWLEVRVDGTTLSPRQPITAAPLAVRAERTQGGAMLGSAINSFIGGGSGNVSSSIASTVGGGTGNTASGSNATVAGGANNVASMGFSTVPGGFFNEANGAWAFAAGRRAKANHNGTYVWADSENIDFASTGNDQYLIQARGGVGIGTNSPLAQLAVRPATGGDVLRLHNTDGDVLKRLDSNGRIGLGIGMSHPSGMLHIGAPFGVNPLRVDTSNGLRLSVRADGSVWLGPPPPLLDASSGTVQITQTAVFRDEVRFTSLSAPGSTPLCRQGFILRDCSSSSRHKEAVEDFSLASGMIEALRPVRFTWLESGEADIGLIAEEVAEVFPELITYNLDGEIAGVKYRHLTAVLVKALQETRREQDEQIAALRAELAAERARTEARLAALEASLVDQVRLAKTALDGQQ